MASITNAQPNDGAYLAVCRIGGCTRCNCQGFQPDPTDPETCIAPGTYPNLCNDPKSAHANVSMRLVEAVNEDGKLERGNPSGAISMTPAPSGFNLYNGSDVWRIAVLIQTDNNLHQHTVRPEVPPRGLIFISMVGFVTMRLVDDYPRP